MRARRARIRLHGALELPPRLDRIAALDREQPQVLERNAARRIDRQHALEDRARGVGAPRLRVGNPQRIQRIEIGVRRVRDRFEQPNALVELASFREIAAELPDEPRVADAGLHGAPQDPDRAGGVAALPVDEREMKICDRHVGPSRDDPLVDLDGIRRASRRERRHRIVNRLIELHQLFRIVVVGVAHLRRRSAGDVAERPQPRGGVGVFGPALSGCRRVEAAQRRGQRAIASAAGKSMYFSRSTMTPASGAQPRFSIADIASKYDGRGALSARSAAVNSARPGRSGAAGNPTALRIVGRMSTCRAAMDETSPPLEADNAAIGELAEPGEKKRLCEFRGFCALGAPDDSSAMMSGTRSVDS